MRRANGVKPVRPYHLPAGGGLDEVGNVHRHLVNLRVVKLLNVLEVPLVVVCHKVDSHSLPAETAAATNPAQQQQHVSVKVTVSLEE